MRVLYLLCKIHEAVVYQSDVKGHIHLLNKAPVTSTLAQQLQPLLVSVVNVIKRNNSNPFSNITVIILSDVTPMNAHHRAQSEFCICWYMCWYMAHWQLLSEINQVHPMSKSCYQMNECLKKCVAFTYLTEDNFDESFKICNCFCLSDGNMDEICVSNFMYSICHIRSLQDGQQVICI